MKNLVVVVHQMENVFVTVVGQVYIVSITLVQMTVLGRVLVRKQEIVSATLASVDLRVNFRFALDVIMENV